MTAGARDSTRDAARAAGVSNGSIHDAKHAADQVITDTAAVGISLAGLALLLSLFRTILSLRMLKGIGGQVKSWGWG